MSKKVITVYPDTMVNEIARLMVENNVSGLPVVEREGQVVGIVTELDLVARNARLHFPHYIQILDAFIYLESTRQYEQELRRSLGTTAEEVMTKPAVIASPEMSVEDLATLMLERKVNPVPVVDAGKLVGIVSRSDLVKLMAREFGESC